jgi:hypothetical protein
MSLKKAVVYFEFDIAGGLISVTNKVPINNKTPATLYDIE